MNEAMPAQNQSMPENNQQTPPQGNTTETTPTPTVQTPPPKPPKSKANMVFIIIAIFSLLATAALGYLYWQEKQKNSNVTSQIETIITPEATLTPYKTSQDEIMEDATAGWETFINTAHNYQISYPTNWKAQTQAPGAIEGAHPEAHMIDIQPINNSKPYPIGIITIQSFDVAPSYNQAERVSLNGINASKVIYPPNNDNNFYSESYLIAKPDNGFIELLIRDTSERTNNEILNQILSTFEFVDEQEGVSMENWQTYTNNQFQFKYPENVTVQQSENYSNTIDISNGLNTMQMSFSPQAEHSLYNQGENSYVVTHNSITWTYIPLTEYCDAGNCGDLSAALQTEYGNNRITLILNGVEPGSTFVNQILSTFEFTN